MPGRRFFVTASRSKPTGYPGRTPKAQTGTATFTPTDTRNYKHRLRIHRDYSKQGHARLTVSPTLSNWSPTQTLQVATTVNTAGGNPTPTGRVILSRGNYTSAAEIQPRPSAYPIGPVRSRLSIQLFCRRSARCRPPHRHVYGLRHRPDDLAAHRAYRASAGHRHY